MHKKIGIIGLGYVGLPLAVAFAESGAICTGFDTDAEKIKKIRAGKSYIDDVSSKKIKELSDSGKLKVAENLNHLKSQNAIIVCVPTPLRKSRNPDVSYIISAAETIAKYLRQGQIIIIESTSYTGTTREVVLPILETSGLVAGKDFHLAFSPERVDPNNKTYGIKNTPKIVGGITPKCGELAAGIYRIAVEKVIVAGNADTAEMVKLVENTFRAVNIGLVNEVAMMCDKLGLNVWEVLEAAKSKPFGFMPFSPGPGIGGHCIPLDPHYLGWKMKSLNFEPRFIDLAGTINSKMPEYVVSRIGRILNKNIKTFAESKIAIIGVAYKPDITDARESPAADVISLLAEAGAQISYYDPLVPNFNAGGRGYNSDMSCISYADISVIITPHRCLDILDIVEKSKIVFDTRNATAGINSEKIERL